MTTPATTTKLLRHTIDLPFPISANRLWRSTSGWVGRGRAITIGARVYCSPEYLSWIKEADAMWLARAPQNYATLGRYRLDLVFSAKKRRGNQDGDNLSKCINDWLQRVQIIRNDCLCEAACWTWGDAPAGCRATVEGTAYTP